MPQTEAGAMLREAAELVDGPRERDHGPKHVSFQAIAHAWTCYLENKRVGTVGVVLPLTALDVAQMMVLLKMTRTQFGEQRRDHFLDQCGYSGIAGMLMGMLKEEPDYLKPGAVVYTTGVGKTR